MGGSDRLSRTDVLHVFEELEDPSESLSTSEVAAALDCPRRTAYSKLRDLAEDDWIHTKTVGANVRIWWLPADRHDSIGSTARNRRVPDLTADHVLELEFHSKQLGQSFIEAGGDVVQIAVDGIVSLADGGDLQYWTITGIPPKTYVETVSNWSTVEDVRFLSTVEETFRVEVRTSDESLFAAFETFDGYTKSGYLEGGKLKIVAEFPSSVEAAAVVEAVQDVYPDLELTGQRLVYTPRLFRTLAEDRLTDRQWTALQLAYYAGYFDRPRESSGDELAGRMGISRQTFHHHLREAERIVFRTLFEGIIDRLSHRGGRSGSDQ